MTMIASSGAAAAAVPREVFVSDGSDDVATSGTVSERTRESADINYAQVYRDEESGRVELNVRVGDGAPLSTEEGTTVLDVALTVVQKVRTRWVKGKKRKYRPKPYRMTLRYEPNDPMDPLVIRSNKSGSNQRVSCGDTAASIDDGYIIYEVYVALAPRCFGSASESVRGSVLVTSYETAGGYARDGVTLPLVSVS